jgi:hypothetical protein
MLPKKQLRRGVNRRNKSMAGNPVDHALALSHPAGELLGRVTCPRDFTFRPAGYALSQSPPKNIRSHIVWLEVSLLKTSGANISTSVDTEYGQSFQINDLSYASQFASLFDQYCIYSVVVNFSFRNGNSNSIGRFVTAIDTDNVTSLGSEAAMAAFSTAETTSLRPETTIQRYINPSISSFAYQGSGTGYAPARAWCDLANTSIAHYGIRAYATGNSASGFVMDVSCTYVIGLRYQI